MEYSKLFKSVALAACVAGSVYAFYRTALFLDEIGIVKPEILADFNGNGKDDMIYKTKCDNEENILFYLESSEFYKSGDNYKRTANSKPKEISEENYGETRLRLEDVNKDGLNDLVVNTKDLFGYTVERVYLSNGKGNFEFKPEKPVPVKILLVE